MHYNANMQSPLFTQTYPRHSAAFNTLVHSQVTQALAEDIGSGDVTAMLINASQTAKATIISRQEATICGIDWVNSCFRLLDADVQIDWQVAEGDSVITNQLLCTIQGRARALLTAERTALNFLQLLSAVASQTRLYVQLTLGTKAKILDTRKTLPGLRLAQKYAVTVGGGWNQRLALYDGILIKENHIAAAGSIKAALAHAQAACPKVPIQIEVETLDELEQALTAGAQNILLDNFSLDDTRKAVARNQGQALLEASGNVHPETVRAIAETGVDRISIGAITKSICAIDLSMRITYD